MAHGYLGGDSEGSSPSMDNGIFSTEMMEKFLLSSIREGTRKCLSSSLPSPLGELVLDELWGGGGGGESVRVRREHLPATVRPKTRGSQHRA